MAVFERFSCTDEVAGIIAEQVVDIELHGEHFGGMSRALSIARMVQEAPRQPTSITLDAPNIIRLDGGNTSGYMVAQKATMAAIEKTKATGVGLGMANNTFFTGQFSHHIEMATRQHLVAIARGASASDVAPMAHWKAAWARTPSPSASRTPGEPVIVDKAPPPS